MTYLRGGNPILATLPSVMLPACRCETRKPLAPEVEPPSLAERQLAGTLPSEPDPRSSVGFGRGAAAGFELLMATYFRYPPSATGMKKG